jgi:hypothetical protein
MKDKGILINNDFDIIITPVRDAYGKIQKGVKIGDSLYQNQGVILTVQPGEIKELPRMGVGINDIVLDQDFLAWRRRIREHLELDGQKVNDVVFDLNKTLMIDAEYSS